MKKLNSIKKNILFLSFIILAIASFVGCSGESTVNKGVTPEEPSKQQKTITIEGNPVLLAELNVQDAENTDSYYFDLTGEYKINVVSGSKVVNSYSSLKEAMANGISLEGIDGGEVVLTKEDLSANKKTLTLVSEGVANKAFDCQIEVLKPQLEDENESENPKLYVSENDGKYTFTTLGGNFKIKLAYFFQPSSTFTSWQEASKFGFQIEELNGEEITISAEEKSKKEKVLTLKYGDELKKEVTCSLEIKAPPAITSFTITKAPVVHVGELPDYSTMSSSKSVECTLENFEITPVWSDPEFVCAINTLELADKYKFTFSAGANGSISLTKANVQNKTVDLTITFNGKSETTSCTIKADTEPERMLSFRVLTTPTIRFTSIPSYNVSTSYIKQGSLVCEATFDKEPYTRQFTVGSTDATNAGFTLPSVLSSSTIAITAAEHSSYGKTVTVSNGRWGLSQTAKLPISIDRASITCYYKGETKTAQVEKGTTLTQTQFLSKFGYDTVPTWYADADGKTKISFPYTVSSNVVLYGLVAYTVNFVNASGTKIAEPQTVLEGGTITNPNIDLTGTWYVGDTKVSNILTYPINQNTTFKRVGSYKVTVMYGSVSTNKTYTEGTVLSGNEFSTFTKNSKYGSVSSGSSVCDFYLDSLLNMKNKVTFPYTVTQNVTFYADRYQIAGYNRIVVNNVNELRTALNSLSNNTLIIMNAGTYDTAGLIGLGAGTLPSKWKNAKYWADNSSLCIAADNVAIVANGAVTLKDSSSSSAARYIGIIGNNVVLNGLRIEASTSGRSIEVAAEGGTVISDCTVVSLYISPAKSSVDSSIPDVKDITIRDCTIMGTVKIANGTSGNILIENNTWESSSQLIFEGRLPTNGFRINISGLKLSNNLFKVGCNLVFKDIDLTKITEMAEIVKPKNLGFDNSKQTTETGLSGGTTYVVTYTKALTGGSIKDPIPVPVIPPPDADLTVVGGNSD